MQDPWRIFITGVDRINEIFRLLCPSLNAADIFSVRTVRRSVGSFMPEMYTFGQIMRI